jgi:nicotinate-nucleotide adenylyltransferase
MNIAIFGGSFDPPHLGHEAVVNEALKSLHVDKLFIIPTYLNPFKKEFFAPSELRLKWLQKLFTCKDVEILDFEVKEKKAVPTIETIEYLQNIYNLEKIYLIIGADNLTSLEHWHRYDELKNIVEFVVAARDETILPKELKKLSINAKISSSKLRSHMNISFIPHKIADEVIEFYKDKNGKQNK